MDRRWVKVHKVFHQQTILRRHMTNDWNWDNRNANTLMETTIQNDLSVFTYWKLGHPANLKPVLSSEEILERSELLELEQDSQSFNCKCFPIFSSRRTGEKSLQTNASFRNQAKGNREILDVHNLKAVLEVLLIVCMMDS